MIYLFWLLFALQPVNDIDLSYALYVVLFLYGIGYIVTKDRRSENQLLFIFCLFAFYILPIDFIFEVSPYRNAIEVILFVSFSMWLQFRPEINDLKYDRNNVLLAFYKGSKGSLKMRFFDLFGLPVKSLCVVCGDSVLRLKDGRYVYDHSGDAICRSSDYVLYDTGIKSNSDIRNKMVHFIGVRNKNSMVYSDCIETISSLLGSIREDLKPVGFWETRPSIYLRKCLKHGKKGK